MKTYKDPIARQYPASTAVILGMVLGALVFVLGLVGCHGGERVTGIYTGFWHSATCHPDIYVASYDKPPEGAAMVCNWQPVLPPPDGVVVPWRKRAAVPLHTESDAET